MAAATEFHVEADAGAREWLELHRSVEPRVIAYDVHRCCGGGKICQVRFRKLSREDDPAQFATGVLEDGTRLLIDRRAAARLPSRFTLTTHGVGRFRHLDLDLGAEQWGRLLYD